MKCSNPYCNRGIGLVAHRRGWFGKRRYCSRNCRYAVVADLPKRSHQKQSASTYFEWLFLQPIENPPQKLMPAVIRTPYPSVHPPPACAATARGRKTAAYL
jgi:hypothetical protein